MFSSHFLKPCLDDWKLRQIHWIDDDGQRRTNLGTTWPKKFYFLNLWHFQNNHIKFWRKFAQGFFDHWFYLPWAVGQWNRLTHWGRVTHISVGNLTIIGSDNGLSPGRRQAIIRTNAGILLIGPLGTNFTEISIGIQTFSFKKMHLKTSSTKWRPFSLGLNVLSPASVKFQTIYFVNPYLTTRRYGKWSNKIYISDEIPDKIYKFCHFFLQALMF